VQCVHLEERIFAKCASSGDFGNKGILESGIDYTHQSCPESLSSLWEEPYDVVKLVYVGFLLLGYELPFPLSNQLTLQEEINRETDPLWSIEIKQ
jgi:hypothetical protein